MKGLIRDKFVSKFGSTVTICPFALITIFYPERPQAIVSISSSPYLLLDALVFEEGGRQLKKNDTTLDKLFGLVYYQFNLIILIIHNYWN